MVQHNAVEDELIFRCHLVTVLTGTLISAAMREHSVLATFSIANLYKEGNLSIQQAGKSMSTKVIILCKKCPLVRRGKWICTDVANFTGSSDFLTTCCLRLQQTFFIYSVAEPGKQQSFPNAKFPHYPPKTHKYSHENFQFLFP